MKKSIILFLILYTSSSIRGQQDLLPEHKDWLELVSPIITKVERDIFLTLKSAGERTRFIQIFWKQRDHLPDTSENEFYQEYMRRVQFADANFGHESSRKGSQTERGYFYLLLGPPLERTSYTTQSQLLPIELWHYRGEVQYGLPPFFYLIFYQPQGLGEYRLYHPGIEGPEKLIIHQSPGQTFNRQRAFSVIKEISGELASASLSYLPGERDLGTSSLSSETIISSVYSVPGKKFSDAYARSYLAYKDYVETEYTDRYIKSAYLVKVFRQKGVSFIHWAIEPDRMNFAAETGSVYAAFELVLKIEDSAGRSIFERTSEIPIRLTAEQYRAHERQRFSFQDFLPVIPGDFKLFMLLKNKTGKNFSTYETRIGIPGENEPGIGPPLLFISAEDAPDSQAGKSKAFFLGGRQYVAGARNEFPPGGNLGVLAQVRDDWSSPAAGGRTFEVEIYSLDSGGSVGAYPLGESRPDPVDPETRTITGIVPLTSLPPGYYRAEVSVKHESGARIASEKENFVILSVRIPVTPWVYSRLQPEVPSAEHLKILGHQYFMARDYEAARSVLERALGRAEDPAARLLLARSLYGLGRFREALESALAVYEKTSDRESAKVIALCYAGLKDWAGAVKYLEEILAEATEVPVLNLAAECYINMGRPEKAGPLLRKSLSLVPDQPAVRGLEEKIAKISKQNKRES